MKLMKIYIELLKIYKLIMDINFIIKNELIYVKSINNKHIYILKKIKRINFELN